MLMVELFAARKVRSVLCKRSVLVAGKTLISEPVSTRKYCLMFESKSRSKWDLPVEWAAFTDWLAGFPIEICRVRGIWSLWSRIWRDTSTDRSWRYWSGMCCCSSLASDTGFLAKSFSVLHEFHSCRNSPFAAQHKLARAVAGLAFPPCYPPCRPGYQGSRPCV